MPAARREPRPGGDAVHDAHPRGEPVPPVPRRVSLARVAAAATPREQVTERCGGLTVPNRSFIASPRESWAVAMRLARFALVVMLVLALPTAAGSSPAGTVRTYYV